MTLEEPKLNLTAKAQEYKYLYRFTPIPLDTKINKTVGGYDWKPYYKDGNLDEKIQKQWTLLESFDKGGIAIILGKARPRDGFDETNVFAIDLDGESAVKAFCTREDGSVATLEELSHKFLLAWHDEDPTSIHLIGYSSKQLKNCTLITKPSPDKELREQIEVKADRMLINMPPSLHKDGGQWTCIGEEKVPDDDRKGETEEHLINVFKRYGVDYTAEQSNYDPTSREQEDRVYQ